MPVTQFQAVVANLLSVNRNPQSYLAGGAALHFEPNSVRYSQDLDYFHDSENEVAKAYALDSALLERENFEIKLQMRQPGYIRAIVKKTRKQLKLNGLMTLHGDLCPLFS